MPARAKAKAGVLLLLAGTLYALAALASLGGPHGAIEGLAAVLSTLSRAGLGPLLYILAGAGFGRLLRPMVRGRPSAAALQLAGGIGLLLLLTQVMGITGLLTERLLGAPVALLVEAAGIALLVSQLIAAARTGKLAARPATFDPTILLARVLWVPPILLMLVAACQPPGRLWSSEFGGFDALSYHLQLPNQWFAMGRIWPVEHNVYSYLPGLIEGAFMHTHAGAPNAPADELRRLGLLSGDARGAIEPQLLHTLLAIASAVLISALGRTLARRAGAPEIAAARAGLLAGAIFLATPWTIVVGSLAYNEMGLTLGLAGAMLACADASLRPAARGALAGLLVGVACGCKPTAIVFAGVPVAILLLSWIPPRQWIGAVAAGCAAGLITLAPWLVRNTLACGNPVFPFAPGLFGAAHWNAEQLARFAAAHHFDGTLPDRLRLLILPDASDPAGPRHRGLLHPQFALFFPLTLAALVVTLATARTHIAAFMLAAGLLAQLLAWLLLTHLQSRFLVPLMVPACGLLALAATLGSAQSRQNAPAARAAVAAPALATLACLALCSVSILLYARQGQPNAALLGGPAAFTGRSLVHQLALLPEPERRRILSEIPPELFVNVTAGSLLPTSQHGKLYLLGDSTPFYFTVPTIYNTTWDRSLLGDAMRTHPADPAAWTRELEAAGARYVLINFAELARLNQSGPGPSSWYDPAVTPESTAAWAQTLGSPVAQWPQTGRYLFRLTPRGSAR